MAEQQSDKALNKLAVLQEFFNTINPKKQPEVTESIAGETVNPDVPQEKPEIPAGLIVPVQNAVEIGAEWSWLSEQYSLTAEDYCRQKHITQVYFQKCRQLFENQ